MYLLLSIATCFSAAIVSNGQGDQLSTVGNFLNRILYEGLSLDPVTTTDVYFLNFDRPKYIDLQDAVIAGLMKTNFTVSVFINGRNEYARNRLFLLIAAPSLDIFENCLNTTLRPTLPDQRLAENSETIHVIVSVLNFDPTNYLFIKLVTLTLSWFKSHQFVIVRSNPSEARLFMVARNMNIYSLRWNTSFQNMFYSRPFNSFSTPQKFAALPSAPRVSQRGDHFEGLDVTVFNVIMSHLNLSYQIVLVANTDSSGNAAELIHLLNKVIVLGLLNRGNRFIDPAVMLTLPNQDGLCILTPKSQRKHLFYHLLQPLDLTSWLMLCGLLSFGAIVSYQCSKYFHQNLMLSLFCGSTVRGRPMYRLEKFTVAGGTFLFMVLLEAYRAKIILHMTTYRYEKDPTTIDEFIKSPDLLLGPLGTVKYCTAIRSSLENKFITVPEHDLYYDSISNTKYGYVLPCASAKTLIGSRAAYDRFKCGTNARPPFHLIPEKLETHQLFYHFSPYFFSFAKFKWSLVCLFESGLTDYWEKNIERQHYVNPAFEFTDTVVLDLDRLLLLWVIYGIGSLVAILVFICELVVRWIALSWYILLGFVIKITE